MKHNLYWKLKFLKHADSIGYVIAKLSKYATISMHNSSDFSLQRIFLKIKGPGTRFQAKLYVEFIYEKSFFCNITETSKT